MSANGKSPAATSRKSRRRNGTLFIRRIMHARIRAMRIGIFFFCAWLLPAAAQVAAPDGWRKEFFDFPLAFAPSIPFVGKEHVRFSPEWTQFDTPRGFSYVVLWDIK